MPQRAVPRIALLLEHRASVHRRDPDGFTALHHAASAPDRGHARILRLLLAAGASPADTTPKGATAADLAREHGKGWMLPELRQR